MHKFVSALLTVASCWLLLAGSALAKGEAKDGDRGKGPAAVEFTETLLSNERDTSRWAFVSESVSAFSKPGERGRKLIKLTRKTPDDTSELVLTLRERVYADGAVWTEVRLPIRSQGTGWVRRAALGAYRVVHSRIEIDRAARTAKLFKNEALVWSAQVAVGRKGHETPAGNFYIRNRLASTDARGRFGPYALGLSAQSKSKTDWPGGRTVGIHGTDKPRSIPGTTRDACVRVTNDQIRALFKLAPPGTPVKIL